MKKAVLVGLQLVLVMTLLAACSSGAVTTSPSPGGEKGPSYYSLYVERDTVTSSGRVTGSVVYVQNAAGWMRDPAFTTPPDAQTVCSIVSQEQSAAPSVAKCTPLTAAPNVGVRFTYSDLTLQQFSIGTCYTAEVITKRRGHFRLCGTLHFLPPPNGVGHLDPASKVLLSTTFPGMKVASSDGSVSGDTVTWKPDLAALWSGPAPAPFAFHAVAR